MVGVSASVNLPLHHKVQKFSSGTGSAGWSRKKGRKTVVGSVEKAFFSVPAVNMNHKEIPGLSRTSKFNFKDFPVLN